MADADIISVNFGAQTAPLKSGLQDAQTAVKTAVDQMRASLVQLQEAAVTSAGVVQDAFAMIGSAVSKMNLAFAAVTAALAGGKMFKDIIHDTLDWTSSVLGLSKALGINSVEASTLGVALRHIGADSDTYTGSLFKLLRQVKTNEQGMNDLGLATRDSNGKFLDGQTVMKNALTTMMQYKEGLDRDEVALAMFSRTAQTVMPMMKLLNVNMQEMEEHAKSLGLVVGQEAVDAMLKYKAATNDLGLVSDGFSVQIGNVLIPVLTELAVKVFPILVTATKILIQFFRDLWAVGDILYRLFKIIGDTIIYAADQIYNAVRLIITSIWALKDGTDAALEAVQKGWEKIKEANAKAAADLKRNVEEMNKDFKTILVGPDTKTPTPTTPKGGDKEAPDFGKGDKEATQLAKWQQMRDEEMIADRNFFRDSKAADLKFWQDKLQQTEQGSTLRMQVMRRIYQDERGLALDQRRSDQVAIDGQINDINRLASAQEQQIHENRQLGHISAAEEKQQLTELENYRHQLLQKSLQEKLDFSKDDVIATQQANEKIRAEETRHAAQMSQIAFKSAQEQRQIWLGLANAISSSIGNAITGILTKSQTLAQGLQNIFTSLVSHIIGLLVKMAAEWILRSVGITTVEQVNNAARLTGHVATEAAKTGATVAGATVRVATDTAAAEESLLVSAATAIKDIAIKAYQAAAGAYAAIAAIPYVGPFLAPAAAAVALGAVLAIGASIASAEGGWGRVPGDQIAQLHKDEMVLPAKIANPLRSQLETNAGLGAGGPGQNGGDVHVHIHAIDTQSGAQFLMNNRAAVGKAVKAHVRDFGKIA